MRFEWDPAKAKANLGKHDVAFEGAVRVFLDPNRLEMEDDREDYDETRWYTIGMVEGVVLAVVYTEGDDTCRIVSARKATRQERKKYVSGEI